MRTVLGPGAVECSPAGHLGRLATWSPGGEQPGARVVCAGPDATAVFAGYLRDLPPGCPGEAAHVLARYRAGDWTWLRGASGVFAFAVVDHRRPRCVLGVDRLGLRPLLVAADEGGVAFASDLGVVAARQPSPARDRRRRAPGADRRRVPARRPHRAPRRRARPARQRPRADPGAAPVDPVLVGVRAGRLAPSGPRRLHRRVAAPPACGHRPPGRSERGPSLLPPERGVRFPAHPARGPCRRRPLRDRDGGPAIRAPPGDDHRARRHRRTLPGPRRRASPGAPPRAARARCRRARSRPCATPCSTTR